MTRCRHDMPDRLVQHVAARSSCNFDGVGPTVDSYPSGYDYSLQNSSIARCLPKCATDDPMNVLLYGLALRPSDSFDELNV
jgi:hypothetical protein